MLVVINTLTKTTQHQTHVHHDLMFYDIQSDKRTQTGRIKEKLKLTIISPLDRDKHCIFIQWEL